MDPFLDQFLDQFLIDCSTVLTTNPEQNAHRLFLGFDFSTTSKQLANIDASRPRE